MRARLISWVSAAGLVLAFSATAQAQRTTLTPCKDGTNSNVVGRGACSGHGGVDARKVEAQRVEAQKRADIERARAKKAAVKTERADARTAAKVEHKEEHKAEKTEVKMVKCTDGSMSKGGRGACSHHGGIAKVVRR